MTIATVGAVVDTADREVAAHLAVGGLHAGDAAHDVIDALLAFLLQFLTAIDLDRHTGLLQVGLPLLRRDDHFVEPVGGIVRRTQRRRMNQAQTQGAGAQQSRHRPSQSLHL
jgi:hypothetical protein